MRGPLKVLFLDFDGVLNHTAHLLANRKTGDESQIDPVAVGRVNRLLEETGARVVFSTTWRIGKFVLELESMLSRRGFKGRAISATPVLYGRCRGDEIQTWLRDYPGKVEQYVILDDHDDMGHLKSRLVQTSMETGITDADVDSAIEMLGRRGA